MAVRFSPNQYAPQPAVSSAHQKKALTKSQVREIFELIKNIGSSLPQSREGAEQKCQEMSQHVHILFGHTRDEIDRYDALQKWETAILDHNKKQSDRLSAKLTQANAAKMLQQTKKAESERKISGHQSLIAGKRRGCDHIVGRASSSKVDHAIMQADHLDSQIYDLQQELTNEGKKISACAHVISLHERDIQHLSIEIDTTCHKIIKSENRLRDIHDVGVSLQQLCTKYNFLCNKLETIRSFNRSEREDLKQKEMCEFLREMAAIQHTVISMKEPIPTGCTIS